LANGHDGLLRGGVGRSRISTTAAVKTHRFCRRAIW
jgi:hypothetical protein